METPMPVTGNPTLDHWLAILGIVMSVSSTAASVLNGKIRAALDAGEEVPALFLYTALAINTVALNVDKAAQMQKLLKGGAVVVTRVGEKKEEPEVKP
jgi:hypothetical protein